MFIPDTRVYRQEKLSNSKSPEVPAWQLSNQSTNQLGAANQLPVRQAPAGGVNNLSIPLTKTLQWLITFNSPEQWSNVEDQTAVWP